MGDEKRQTKRNQYGARGKLKLVYALYTFSIYIYVSWCQIYVCVPYINNHLLPTVTSSCGSDSFFYHLLSGRRRRRLLPSPLTCPPPIQIAKISRSCPPIAGYSSKIWAHGHSPGLALVSRNLFQQSTGCNVKDLKFARLGGDNQVAVASGEEDR